jgi:N-acetylglucosaminyldiphosphoundecaprenol N-acetyl-beta-D-mannosaminyltransferase
MSVALPEPLPVLGHAVHPLTLDAAAAWVVGVARGPCPRETRLVVTLNPEIVVRARRDERLARALRAATLTVADGVGVLWAARRRGSRLPGRVPGVELVERALALGGRSLRVYYLGGRPGVAERAAAHASERWGVAIAGVGHGYFDRARDAGAVVADIGRSRPDLLLVGLGEDQEVFIHEHAGRLGAKAAIGVGGSLDVLAGAVNRTPAWTRRLGIEWVWRVGLDPKRWHRVPRLAAFVSLALREPPGRASDAQR